MPGASLRTGIGRLPAHNLRRRKCACGCGEVFEQATRNQRYIRGHRPAKKAPAGADPDYLAWIRKQPCIVTRQLGNGLKTWFDRIEAHHVRNLNGLTGAAIRPPDRYAVPLLASEHAKAQGRDRTFWAERGIDIRAEIERLNAEYEASR